MSCYVDKAIHPYGRMKMCHLLADSEQELHDMAAKIGVQRKWFQGPPHHRHPHYDICKQKRKLAIAYGAIELKSLKETAKILTKIRQGETE